MLSSAYMYCYLTSIPAATISELKLIPFKYVGRMHLVIPHGDSHINKLRLVTGTRTPSPLEMCAVGGLLGGALGRMFGGSPQFLFVFYRPDRRKMFVVSAVWCPQLTNEHCEVLFFHKCSCKNKLNPAYMGPIQDINTYVYI